MKRMTIRNSDCTVSQPTNLNWENVLYRLAAYEDTGLEPEDLQSTVNIDYVRIMELLKADKDGRLVVLPKGSNCDDCPLCCGGCGGCRITGYPPNPDKCRAIIREEAETALAGKENAVPDAPEEPAEPEWKGRVMRTFLGGR